MLAKNIPPDSSKAYGIFKRPAPRVALTVRKTTAKNPKEPDWLSEVSSLLESTNDSVSLD